MPFVEDNLGLLVAELKVRVFPPRLAILLLLKKESVRWLNIGGVPLEELYQPAWIKTSLTADRIKLALVDMEKLGLIRRAWKGKMQHAILTELGDSIIGEIKKDFDQAYKAWEGMVF